MSEQRRSVMLINDTRGLVLASTLFPAHSLLSRLRGLLFRPPLPPDTGLWLKPCNGIHMFFMTYAIDVLFHDGDLRVVRLVENLRPWRAIPYVPGAVGAMEFPAGALTGKVAVGDQLSVSTGPHHPGLA